MAFELAPRFCILVLVPTAVNVAVHGMHFSVVHFGLAFGRTIVAGDLEIS